MKARLTKPDGLSPRPYSECYRNDKAVIQWSVVSCKVSTSVSLWAIQVSRNELMADMKAAAPDDRSGGVL